MSSIKLPSSMVLEIVDIVDDAIDFNIFEWQVIHDPKVDYRDGLFVDFDKSLTDKLKNLTDSELLLVKNEIQGKYNHWGLLDLTPHQARFEQT